MAPTANGFDTSSSSWMNAGFPNIPCSLLSTGVWTGNASTDPTVFIVFRSPPSSRPLKNTTVLLGRFARFGRSLPPLDSKIASRGLIPPLKLLTVSELPYWALNRATSTAWRRSLRLFFTTNTATPCCFCAMRGNTESSKYGSITISSCFAMSTNFFICSFVI